jgi:hypothetical protein
MTGKILVTDATGTVDSEVVCKGHKKVYYSWDKE